MLKIPFFRSVKAVRLILGVALIASVLLFLSTWLTATGVFDRVLSRNAEQVSHTLAQTSFNAMYEVMRHGWSRDQVESFIASLQRATGDADYHIDIYRGDLVRDLYGEIEQPHMDEMIVAGFEHGRNHYARDENNYLRYTYPLTAKQECLACHYNAVRGDVLGMIEVRQDLGPILQQTRRELMYTLIWSAALPLLAAMLVAAILNARINRSLMLLDSKVDSVCRVSDLTALSMQHESLGIAELDQIFDKMDALVHKLREVAVDRDLLEFEIRLLEKFVITSEVVKDWREYISGLLVEINHVIDTHILFSVFKLDEDLFDLEVFWLQPPCLESREYVEKLVLENLKGSVQFSGLTALKIDHQIALPDAPVTCLDRRELELQTKSLLLDVPKIGGIVGIGVQSEIMVDKTKVLVMESVLSTLLNVVGSVKAIYKYTRELEYYATRDPLTNLYNQRMFWELLENEILRAHRDEDALSLLIIDLDNFKTINDTYGHGFGDRFLQSFATTLSQVLRNGEVFSRYGGDEFALILPKSDVRIAHGIADRILRKATNIHIHAPDGTEVTASVSIGLASYPVHAEEAKDLFLFADNMMYKAKTDGKNRIGLPCSADELQSFRAMGERNMMIVHAIEQRLVVPYFQPILDLQSNNITAYEVLCRIHMPDGRVVGAHEFIEAAERAGLIHQIDMIMIDKALGELSRQAGDKKLFINLSPRALVMNEFIPQARELCAHHGIDPTRIVFEMTERETVKNFAMLEKIVMELKLEGFGLAIDDFGSGFSSFHYLKHFPIDYVKIEGEFIANMAHDKKDLAFVRSITALVHQLGIRSLAEFVEDHVTQSLCQELDIGYGQGFYIGRPMPEMVDSVEVVDA